MTVQEYYEQVPPAAKVQLENLRKLIQGELKDPQEVISYQIPHFVSSDKKVVAIAGWKEHVSIYPLSASVLQKFSQELADYQTSRGTVQFPLDQKLPAVLIRKIVRHRLRELS